MSLIEDRDAIYIRTRINRVIKQVHILLLFSVFFLSSCGIPNPLPPVENVSVTNVLPNTNNTVKFSTYIIVQSPETCSGFNIYYEYTDTTEVNEYSNRYNLSKAQAQNSDGANTISNSPILRLLTDTVSDGEVVYGELEYNANQKFIVRIYSDDLLQINDVDENYIVDDEDGESLIIQPSTGQEYLHLYIEYYVYDKAYSPSYKYSEELGHLGYIKL